MSQVTITLSAERMQQLKELARKASVTPEELVRLRVEEWLKTAPDRFLKAANYVLEKNQELYRRLS